MKSVSGQREGNCDDVTVDGKVGMTVGASSGRQMNSCSGDIRPVVNVCTMLPPTDDMITALKKGWGGTSTTYVLKKR